MTSIIASLSLVVLSCILIPSAGDQTKVKRQIYREQVLPLSGGKIPEEAFRADRLALNRLNKEGIAIPDGVLLEHRHVHSHPHRLKHDPEDEADIIRIIQQPENRFVPEEGRYHDENHRTIASTYIIRKPIGREETNIRTPDQQRPLHQAIRYKEQGLYHQNNHQGPPKIFHQQQQQQQQHYRPLSHRFQRPYYKPQVQAYTPIPVPLELPNREIQGESFYVPQFDNNYPTGEEISSKIEWPLLLNNIDRLQGEINNVFPTGYHFQSAFFEPEAIAHYTNHGTFFTSINDRFARKSSESYQGASKKAIKINASAKRRTDSKRVPPVRCNNVPGPSNNCEVL